MRNSCQFVINNAGGQCGQQAVTRLKVNGKMTALCATHARQVRSERLKVRRGSFGIQAEAFAQVSEYWLRAVGRIRLHHTEISMIRDWLRGFPAQVHPAVRVEVVKRGIARARETFIRQKKTLYGLRACRPHIEAAWEDWKARHPGALWGRVDSDGI